ncbi:MAG: polyprenyl synthetase family protein [Rhodothermales bacterium]|nr:polyprenyl synthetase family protein [Rhodothermales bacterium]
MATPVPRSLTAIQAPVDAEMRAFDRYFRESMQSDTALLNTITRYVLRQKGKRIRPLLVLLSAKVCGGVTDASYRGGALVELMHTATLVHDDVVDEADRRRGMLSINAIWKNKAAVLFGDFLLSRGLLLALEHRDYAMLHALSDAVRRMSEGELLQLKKARQLDIDEATYFRIISDKTASLIAACTTIGALSATDDVGQIETMNALGEHLGLAFQIRDDLFDFGGDDVGKPLGIDLQERKMTLPLIVALERAGPAERRRILRIVKKKTKDQADIRAVAAFVHETGGIAYAEARMQALAGEARAFLMRFPDSEARAAMVGLSHYIVQRKT